MPRSINASMPSIAATSPRRSGRRAAAREQRAHGGAVVDGVLQVIADVVARVGGAELALCLERDPGDARRRDVLGQRELAAGRMQRAGDELRQHRLAGAVAAEHCPLLARRRAPVEAAQEQSAVQAHGDLAQAEPGCVGAGGVMLHAVKIPRGSAIVRSRRRRASAAIAAVDPHGPETAGERHQPRAARHRRGGATAGGTPPAAQAGAPDPRAFRRGALSSATTCPAGFRC